MFVIVKKDFHCNRSTVFQRTQRSLLKSPVTPVWIPVIMVLFFLAFKDFFVLRVFLSCRRITEAALAGIYNSPKSIYQFVETLSDSNPAEGQHFKEWRCHHYGFLYCFCWVLICVFNSAVLMSPVFASLCLVCYFSCVSFLFHLCIFVICFSLNVLTSSHSPVCDSLIIGKWETDWFLYKAWTLKALYTTSLSHAFTTVLSL